MVYKTTSGSFLLCMGVFFLSFLLRLATAILYTSKRRINCYEDITILVYFVLRQVYVK